MAKISKPAASQVPLKNLAEIGTFFKLNWTTLLLLVVITLTAYAAGLGGQFLSADDISSIVQNSHLRDFSATAKSLNFTSIYASALLNTFGVNPFPFHMATLLVHICNSVLVLLLAYLLLGKRVALYASLIFCLLPAGSEAIFWISGTSYIFQAFFSLVCITLFFLYTSTQNWRFLGASVLVYAGALVSLQTPWMLTIPIIIILLDLFVARPMALHTKLLTSLKARWQYVWYFLAAAGFWIKWVSGQFAVRVTGLAYDYYASPTQSAPLLKRLPYTISKAVELYVFPWRLSFFHEEVLASKVYAVMVVVTALLVILVVYLVVARSKTAGLLLVILASIAPTFSPVQVAWFIAERYLYLGGAFFAMLVALALIKIDYKFNIKNLASYSLAALLIFYSARLITRAADFRTSKDLWTATQKTAPTSYRVYNNLGDVYSNAQDWDKAVVSFKTAIILAPDYADAIHNLGYTYMLMGDYTAAKKYLLESYQKDGRLWQALDKLGRIELSQQNIAEAQKYFMEAKGINPNFSEPKLPQQVSP